MIYQLALNMPGMVPLFASSRKQIRDIWNLRRYPRGRPVRLQRFLSRTGDELRGSLFNFSCAAIRSSSEEEGLRTIFLSVCRSSHLRSTSVLRRACFALCAVVIILLLFAGRPFLPLFAVRVCLINHINAPLSSDDLISLGRVCFN